MRVLVTGAGGQLAIPIADGLARAGFEPVLVGRRKLDVAIETYEWRLLEGRWTRGSLSKLIAQTRISAIVNLAGGGVRPGAIDAHELLESNVALPARLLNVAGGSLAAFVNIGSGTEYAPTDEPVPLNELAPLTADHLYGLSKAAGGLSACAAALSEGTSFAHLRLFGAFGEHEAPHRLLPALVSRLVRGETVALSDGLQIRDWLYERDVGDAVAVTTTALLNGAMPSGFYNLGSERGMSVREFALRVSVNLGASDALLRFGALARRSGEGNALVANAERFFATTGWRPKHDFEDGLSVAIERLRTHKSITVVKGGVA